MVVVRAWALVVSLVAHAGCATGGRDTPPATDAGRDTGRDAVMDGTADVESPDARLPCERDEDCDDGLRCSGVERCVEGRCAAGEPVRCDDGVRCTRDECAEPDGTCTSRPDDGACPAGLVCDAADDCVAPRACASDAECDDGMFCNGVERCDPSFGCRRGEPPSCDDGRACTLDRCNPTTDACESLPDDGRCSDGRRCNGVELCRPAEPGADARGCVVGTPVACDDGIACTQDVCDEATGTCRSEPRDAACDDGVFCNGSERCEPMRGCQAGTPPACEDAIGCTRGRCDAATDRCVQEPDDAACQDGLACNGMERCDATGATPGRGCVAGTALRCDDGLACTTDRCVEPGRCEYQGTDADGDGFVALGCGAGNDCNDANPRVHPGATEVCDGVDNDCNGRPDDGAGMQCALGSGVRSCTTSCGSSGTQTCTAACTLTPCTASEACNGCDDDGDGAADEDFACVRGTSRGCTTACGTAGTQSCNASCSGFSACTASEACNGCDDDGDGAADEDFACVRGTSRGCTTACGTAGTQSCNASCSGYSVCRAAAETCGNGCDDDGNGLIDDGCPTGPTNDACSAAIVLSPASGGTLSGTTSGARRDVTDCGWTGPEVFYRISVSVRSLVYFDTFGTSYDTSLSLRPACGAGQIACEDDDCGTLQDQLVAVVDPGTYYLAVHAFSSGSTGAFQLRWQSFPVPTNGTPTRITANGTYSGSTAGTSSGWTSCAGSGVENFHYFTLCPSTSRTVTASTCSLVTWDTVLSIANASVLACADDSCGLQSSVSAAVSGPGAYLIVVDSYSCCSTNAYSLSVSGL